MTTDKKQIGDDEEKWDLFEKLLEMWDSDKLIELMRSEYQRGRNDERNENLGKILGHLEGMLPKMATKEDLDRWAAQTITHGEDHKPLASAEEIKPAERSVSDQKPLNVTACEEAHRVRSASEIGKGSREPEKRVSDALMAEKGPKKGRPDDHPSRPEGIPTTFAMIREVLVAESGLQAKAVVDRIAAKWWPGLQFKFLAPDISTAVTQGRLARSELGSLTVTEKGLKSESIDNRLVTKAQQPPQRAVVHAGAKLGPPARGEGELLEHGGQSVMLRPREYVMAKKLLAAKGQHIDANFLASSIGLPRTNAVNHETALRDLQATMNPKVRQVGLEVEFWRGFGFLIKEVSSCG